MSDSVSRPLFKATIEMRLCDGLVVIDVVSDNGREQVRLSPEEAENLAALGAYFRGRSSAVAKGATLPAGDEA